MEEAAAYPNEPVQSCASAPTSRQSTPAKTVCQEETPPQRSMSALVLSLAVLLVEGRERGEMAEASPSPLAQRTEEGGVLLCSTELTGAVFQETIPLEWSKCVQVLNVESPLMKEVEGGKLAVSSPPPPVEWMEEGDVLLCGTAELTGRQNRLPWAVSVWSKGRGRGMAWQLSLQSEPHLGESEEEPKMVAVQDTGQTIGLHC